MLPRYYLYDTIDPGNPSADKIQVKFPYPMVQRWMYKETTNFYNLETAKKVLDNPKRIFYGTRTLSEGWWCYVGKPDEWYVIGDVKAPFPSENVFAILMDAEFEVYGIRAEPSAADDPLSPINWRERYGQLIWKKS